MEQLNTLVMVFVYLAIVGFLGWRGFRGTRSVTDYLLGGRETHPYVMAMSYGATFISTSAIVGFGGVAAIYGMGLMWLTFTNIFFGIFIAFVLFGMPTRRLGLRLDAHTFPELLGRRYQSRAIQGTSAGIIFVFMPLYASAVLMSAAKYFSQHIGLSYEAALLVFASIVAVYVVLGGLKGVMYTDAFQATVMVAGMIVLLCLTYANLGGIQAAYDKLAGLQHLVPEKLALQGHQGWTHFPRFGSVMWWNLVGTIMTGVSIGVLAQPQLVVRYMTVKSEMELNRAVAMGGLFILLTVGAAYMVGPLINVHFQETSGKIAIAAAAGDVERIIPMYVTQALPHWFSALFLVTLLSAAMSTLSGQFHTVGTALGRDIMDQTLGKGAGGMRITRLGMVLGILFSVWLGLQLESRLGKTGTEIVARGTSLFFGLCASAFLPMYAGALWSRAITKAGAFAGMAAGLLVSAFWMLFMQEKIATSLLLCQKLFHVRSLGIRLENGVEVFRHSGPVLWAYVDPALVALPIALLVTLLVSAFTPKFSAGHLKRCFGN
ncbi:MAG: sodium:solute symporter family protein [Kiritimatiellia bacterium]